MILEELIYKKFIESEELSDMLADFSGRPAVFNPEAPEDNQPGWNGKSQYPRLIYNYDLQANEERNSAGTLSVFVYCQNTQDTDEITPEEIEPAVKDCLKDVLIKPTDGPIYAFTWARSDAFELEEKKNSLIIGTEIRFDILEYAGQETTDPDPITATNRYIKQMYPECVVVGYDNMAEITKASNERPVIFCRLMSSELAEQTNTVVWLDGRIAVHILCPDNTVRLKMAMAVAQKLSLDGEIILLDKSPMFIRRLQMDNKSDYLKDGQIFITGRYGVLRYRAKPYELNNAETTYS
nr:MAG TPA: hypothetical protein [Caudoviricetes sp.]